MVETINKLVRVQRQLLQELGREPSPEEIAENMDIPVERVREIQKISQEPVSLETPMVKRKTAILEISFRMIMFLFRQRQQLLHFLRNSLLKYLELLQKESRRY